MIIKMKDTRAGTEDGFVIRRFQKNKMYDIADSQARAFIRAGYAYEPNLTPEILAELVEAI